MDEVGPLNPDQAMHMALLEARKGLGHVHPNPPVGAVILDDDGKLLAKGFHPKFGGPHAEIAALENLQDKSKLGGATMYVTLEPCAHQGKTGSCALALSKLPLRKVVYGLQDPNPLVNGGGAKILRQSGIEVEPFKTTDFALEQDLEFLPEIFLKNMRQRQAFVSLKLATTLDGKMAMATGESQWITGESSRQQVHALRAQHDAVLVGGRTLQKDNPRLSVRHPDFPNHKNKIIVFDPVGSALQKLSGDELIFQDRQPQDIFWLTENVSAPTRLGVQMIKWNWKTFAADLFAAGIHSVFVEGGAYVASEFLKFQIIDRLHLFMAPFVLGSQAMQWSQTFQLEDLKDRQNFYGLRMQNFSDDAYLSLRYGSSSRLNENS